MKHYKDFFLLVKDYYEELNAACVALDNDEHLPFYDGHEPDAPYINDEEQLRLSLHMILDAIDQIDNEQFWTFVNSTSIKNKK